MEYTVSSIAPIYLLPVLAFIINAFWGRKFSKGGAYLSVAAIVLSFFYTCRIFKDFIFGKYATDYYVHKVFNWIDISFADQIFKIDLGIYIDNMAVIMLLMVTGVASLIHIYSTWYMDGDKRHDRFFTFLPLFTSAMIGLVLADNLLLLFIFWEIMGFCSYSLIGIYYEKEAAGDASLKAFMTTRVGDVLFLLGILAIWQLCGSVSYVDLYAGIADGKFSGQILGVGAATFAGLMIFMGNMGKSAQFPLQVWLPDAMMGPTPGSALIHAATMVAAGCYLSLRVFPLLEAGGLLPFVAIIGGITAVLAATIALVQTDFKAVLAYSTISQLGYMVLGVGMSSYNAAFMHIITHAVFKACLFMSAGSVIHAIHEQQLPKMGGLRKKLPITFFAIVCCTLAISGIPGFSAYVSKDRILGDALYMAFFGGSTSIAIKIACVLGFIGAFLTPFYMSRWLFLAFFGKPRDQHIYDHAHHEHFKWNHNGPLLVLALFTLGVFYSGSLTGLNKIRIFPESKNEWFQTLVQAPKVENFKNYKREQLGATDTRESKTWEHAHFDDHHTTGFAGRDVDMHKLHTAHTIGAIGSVFIALAGIFLAFLMYIKKAIDPAKFVNTFSGYYRWLVNKYYMDDFYLNIVIKKVLFGIQNTLAFIDLGIYDRYAIDGMASVNRFCFKISKWFDDVVIDGVGVDGTGTAVNIFNLVLRIVQSGKIQFYFIVLIVSLAGYIFTI